MIKQFHTFDVSTNKVNHSKNIDNRKKEDH